MYDRVLAVPRLVSFHDLINEPVPHPRLKQIRPTAQRHLRRGTR